MLRGERNAIGGAESGQNFFERPLCAEERPGAGDRRLDVKVMWGPIVLAARSFGPDETVTVGEDTKASFQLCLDWLLDERFTLCSPDGQRGHLLHAAAGMVLDLRRGGGSREANARTANGATDTVRLRPSDRARVRVGQLAFVVQYTGAARGLHSEAAYRRDFQLGKWWWTCFILAAGLWFAIGLVPEARRADVGYLANPSRFAALIMPSQKRPKKTFEAIDKRRQEKIDRDDSGRWKKVTERARDRDEGIAPRRGREQDREVATNAGILRLLKQRGGGGEGASVFGGTGSADLDHALNGIGRHAATDGQGFGNLTTRGGSPGGGGSLGIGGIGGHGGYGSEVAAADSLRIGHRGKARVRVPRGRSRIVGGLSQKVVGRYIERYWSRFKFCYERELAKNPNLYGKVTCTFTIAGNGRVSEASVLQSTMHSTTVEHCLLRTVRQIRFPPPKGGGEVIVTYPFLFSTAG